MINETLFHDERGVYRARTGSPFGSFPLGNGQYVGGSGLGSGATFPVAGTIPMAKSHDGLLSTTGVLVLGNASVDFERAGIKIGDFLYNGGAGGVHAVRKITEIERDRMRLEQAFPVDIANSPVLVCGRQDLKMIVIDNVDTSDSATLQEAPFGPGKNYLGGGAPVAYDAGSAVLEITIHK